MSNIKGQFKKDIFVGDNGYRVSLFKVASVSEDISIDLDSTITITGYFHDITSNDTYLLNGSLVDHPKYGTQFKADNYSLVKPEGKDAMVEFLSSDIFPGIGSKTAARIVEQFKDKAFDIILNNPNDLYLVPRLSKKNIDTLHNQLTEYESSYKIILDLNELGFSTKDAVRISSFFKVQTAEVLSDNLYRLLEIKDLAFRKIDEIALRNDYLKDDPRRVEAGIIYTLSEVAFSLGHCYLSYEELFNYSKRALVTDLNREQFDECIYELKERKEIIIEANNYYLKQIHEDEEYVSTRINYLLQKEELVAGDLELEFQKMTKKARIKYSDNQKQAILESQKSNFLIITGGPGTGKTTIVKAIVDLYQKTNKLSMQQLHNDVALLSPTGRASKRLAETSLMPASTIHRFLKWNRENDSFQLNERNKASAKLVIIDETSMIDIGLISSLFKALRMDCRVIMVGDYQQLPSVGPGQMLKDIIDSNVAPVVFLKELYRTAQDSEVISLAYGVNSGLIDYTMAGEDLIFASGNIMTAISEIVLKYSKVSYKEFQILAPMYKGVYGIDNINKLVQNILNPRSPAKKEINYFDTTYREGDKVLQLVNLPDENVYNGDVGIIEAITPKELIINFDGNIVSYKPSDYHNFTLAYAISVHKAQGSEFQIVVLPLAHQYYKMLYRKLYYTAITRAKSKLYIIGDPKLLQQASNNDQENIRKTTLCDKLKNKYSSLKKN